MTDTKTFEEWKKKVDAQLVSLCGLCSDDLPDCPYMDWFEDGYSPKEAAVEALENAAD